MGCELRNCRARAFRLLSRAGTLSSPIGPSWREPSNNKSPNLTCDERSLKVKRRRPLVARAQSHEAAGALSLSCVRFRGGAIECAPKVSGKCRCGVGPPAGPLVCLPEWRFRHLERATSEKALKDCEWKSSVWQCIRPIESDNWTVGSARLVGSAPIALAQKSFVVGLNSCGRAAAKKGKTTRARLSAPT